MKARTKFIIGGIRNPHGAWRYTLISGVVPAIPLIVIRPFLPESPAWRAKKAAGTLKRPSIRELFAGRSVLLISHRFSTVRHVDRIYVMRRGEIVEHGTHEQLLSDDGLYAELFGLQATPYR